MLTCFVILMPGLRGAWRSLVAHLLWEQGVGGSNPLAPTAKLAGPRREPCGCSSTVEPQPSKLVMGVRFPSPALAQHYSISACQLYGERLSFAVLCGEYGPASFSRERGCAWEPRWHALAEMLTSAG